MEKSPVNEVNAASPLVEQPPPYSAEPPATPQATVYQATPPGPYHPGPAMVQPAPVLIQPVVVAAAACPACQAGILTERFTLCGICLAVCFFPLGILCCFLMRQTRCTNCRAVF